MKVRFVLRVSREELKPENFQLRCSQIAGEWSTATFFPVFLDIKATFHEVHGHYARFVAIATVPADFNFDTIASARLFRSDAPRDSAQLICSHSCLSRRTRVCAMRT